MSPDSGPVDILLIDLHTELPHLLVWLHQPYLKLQNCSYGSNLCDSQSFPRPRAQILSFDGEIPQAHLFCCFINQGHQGSCCGKWLGQRQGAGGLVGSLLKKELGAWGASSVKNETGEANKGQKEVILVPGRPQSVCQGNMRTRVTGVCHHSKP